MLRLTIALLIILQAGTAWAVVFKIGTMSPAGSSWMNRMQTAAEEVAQKTNNRVTFKFYPGGVMGDDDTVLRKMRVGQLQGGAIMGGSLVDVYPDLKVYHLPLLFKSFAEVDYVRQRMDQTLIDGLETKGLAVLGLAEAGFAYIMSMAPIRTLEDIRKQKVWTPEGDVTSQTAVKTFNIKPIPLGLADVRTGLQTGMIDTVATSPVGAIALQWHTQVKYLTDLPIIYLFGVMAINKKAFDELSPEDQKIVRESIGRTIKEVDRDSRSDNLKAFNALQKQGLTLVKPDLTAMSLWEATAETSYKRLVESKALSPKMYNTIRDHLTAARGKRP